MLKKILTLLKNGVSGKLKQNEKWKVNKSESAK